MCGTERHFTSIYGRLKYALRLATILNFVTKCRWPVSCKVVLSFCLSNNPRDPCDGGLCGPQNRSVHCSKKKCISSKDLNISPPCTSSYSFKFITVSFPFIHNFLIQLLGFRLVFCILLFRPGLYFHLLICL